MHFKAIFLEKNNENKRKRQKENNLKGLPAAWSRGCRSPSCCCNPHCPPYWEGGKRSVKAHKLQAQWSYLVSHRALALEDMKACGRLELTWILPLDVLPSHKICLTLSNSRIPRLVSVIIQFFSSGASETRNLETDND